MNFIALPIIIPLLTAILNLIFSSTRFGRNLVSLVSSITLFIVGLVMVGVSTFKLGNILSLQLGSWVAPFGITLVADTLSAVMITLTGLVSICVIIYSFFDVDEIMDRFWFHPLFHILQMGVCGAFLTGDIFNLYVWFEVLLMASFALIALNASKQQLQGTLKYVLLNLVSSTFLLVGIGLIYGYAGSLNMAHLSVHMRYHMPPEIVSTISLFFIIAFGMKAALFPMYFWLPASYHMPKASIAAFFSALLTKVGVYVFLRTFTLLFVSDISLTHHYLLILSILTMFIGILGALIDNNFKRVLSFNIVSHIGYMTLGLAIFTAHAISGAVLYLMHHMIVITCLFLIAGLVEKFTETNDITNMGGLYKTQPALAIGFMIAALALSGIPPLSGFIPKFILLEATMEAGEFFAAFISLLVSLFTLLSMMRLWREVFWKKPLIKPAAIRLSFAEQRMAFFPITFLLGLILVLGFIPKPFYMVSNQAAHQLRYPVDYILKVANPEPINQGKKYEPH